MKVKIDTREFDRATKQFQKDMRRSLAGAINTTFIEYNKAARDNVTVASRADINRFRRSDVAKNIAIARVSRKRRKGQPAKDQVREYLNRMVKSKRAAIKFTRSLVNAAFIMATGRKPQRPGGVEASGRKASNRGKYLGAWVRVSYTFKGGRRKNAERVINDAYKAASKSIGRVMADKAAKAVERAAKKAGLK